MRPGYGKCGRPIVMALNPKTKGHGSGVITLTSDGPKTHRGSSIQALRLRLHCMHVAGTTLGTVPHDGGCSTLGLQPK